MSVSVVQKNVLVVNPAVVSATNVKELIAQAKAQPGKLSFGSAGTGTSQQMSGELFKSMAGVDIIHVPYKGSAAAMNDLLGGQISMMFTDIPTVDSAHQGRQAQGAGRHVGAALAGVAGRAADRAAGPGRIRSEGLVRRAGAGEHAEAGDRQAERRDHQGAANSPELKEKLLSMGMEPIALDPAQSASYMKTEIDRWANVVKISGAKID